MNLTRELETIFFIMIASVIGLYAIYFLRIPKDYTNMRVVTPLPSFLTIATPTPTVTPLPQPTNVSWNASDGKEKVNMQTIFNADTTKTYTFSTEDTTNNKETLVSTQTVGQDVTFAIPYNTFSSDDNYFFLTRITGDKKEYLVFKTNGEVFSDGSMYIAVTPLFTNYTSNYTISDVTGWADPTLMIVNVKDSNNNKVSYWFDVSSKSFIPLSNYFE